MYNISAGTVLKNVKRHQNEPRDALPQSWAHLKECLLSCRMSAIACLYGKQEEHKIKTKPASSSILIGVVWLHDCSGALHWLAPRLPLAMFFLRQLCPDSCCSIPALPVWFFQVRAFGAFFCKHFGVSLMRIVLTDQRLWSSLPWLRVWTSPKGCLLVFIASVVQCKWVFGLNCIGSVSVKSFLLKIFSCVCNE